MILRSPFRSLSILGNLSRKVEVKFEGKRLSICLIQLCHDSRRCHVGYVYWESSPAYRSRPRRKYRRRPAKSQLTAQLVRSSYVEGIFYIIIFVTSLCKTTGSKMEYHRSGFAHFGVRDYWILYFLCNILALYETRRSPANSKLASVVRPGTKHPRSPSHFGRGPLQAMCISSVHSACEKRQEEHSMRETHLSN